MDNYFSLLLRMVSMLSSENYGRKSISLDMVPYRCRLFKEARLRLLSHVVWGRQALVTSATSLRCVGTGTVCTQLVQSLHSENVIVY